MANLPGAPPPRPKIGNLGAEVEQRPRERPQYIPPHYSPFQWGLGIALGLLVAFALPWMVFFMMVLWMGFKR